MGDPRVFYDGPAKDACKRLLVEFEGMRQEIIQHSQFRRVTAVSPQDPNWGQPNPIDITGMIERAFSAGIMYANEAKGEK